MKRLLLSCLVALTLTGCAMTSYYPHDRPGQVEHGAGGYVTIVGGFEVWAIGAAPSRPFQRLGIVAIQDLDNAEARGRIDDALAAAIGDYGGQAAITLEKPDGPIVPGFRAGYRGQKTDRYEIVRYVAK